MIDQNLEGEKSDEKKTYDQVRVCPTFLEFLPLILVFKGI